MTPGGWRRDPARPAGRVLVASLADDRAAARHDVRDLLRAGAPADLAVAARWHRVAGFLLDAVRGEPALAGLAAELEADWTDSARRELRALADLRRLVPVLDGAGVPWLAMKGPVLVDRYYGAAGLRSYDDIDLLVPAERLDAALGALLDAGCASVEQNWALMTALRAGEVQLRGWHGTPVDLHWALLFRGELRDRFAIDAGSALARARTARVADADVATFDPVDTLVHLCLHAAMEGGHRLIWTKDVQRCVAVDAPAWDAVVERAREWRVAVPVGLMLARARHTLGVPVPGAVTRRLVGGRLAHGALAAVDAAWPVRRASDRGSPARMLARSARATAGQTCGELGRRVADLRPRNVRELLRPATKASRSAMLYASGGGATRAGFLASVTGTAARTGDGG